MGSWFATNSVSILNGVAFGMLLYMMAVGLSLMFGMMGVLNLAHGTLFLLGAYLAVEVVGSSTAWYLLVGAVALGAAVGIVAGLGIGLMTRPLVSRGHMDQAILTIGIFLAAAIVMEIGFGKAAQSVPVPAALKSNIDVFGSPYPLYRLGIIVLGLVIALAIELLLVRTVLGATIRAIVADEDMVKATGTDTRRLYYGVFAAGAALAVVAGVVGAPIVGASPGLDGQVLLLALVVVVVGGLGSTRGALIAALLIGLVKNLGTILVPQLAPFLIFGTMVVALLLRPEGLLRKRVAA